MNRDSEQLSVDFTAKAQKLFTYTYQKFSFSIKNLDRQKDENVFQLQLGKYLNTLRSQLESIAKESVMKNKNLKNQANWSNLLGDKIDIYLKEFRQKARLL